MLEYVITSRSLIEVDVPNSVSYRNQTPIFEWHVVRHGSSQNMINHSEFNSQHNLGWGKPI